MIPVDIQLSRSNVYVKGQAYLHMLGKGGISVLQTSLVSFSVREVTDVDKLPQRVPHILCLVWDSL